MVPNHYILRTISWEATEYTHLESFSWRIFMGGFSSKEPISCLMGRNLLDNHPVKKS